MQEKPVSVALRTYTRTCLGLDIRAMEVGAGGDCLFHSFAAALARMLQSDGDVVNHVVTKLPRPEDMRKFGSRDQVVQLLRKLSARAFALWPPEAVFDLLLSAAVQQRYHAFQDGWNPEDLFVGGGFECLRNESNELAESVLAFEHEQNGDAILRIAFTPAVGGRQEVVRRVPGGSGKFFEMREALQGCFSQMGDFHWGTQTDVKNLSEALNIGVFMFCDALQEGGQQPLYKIGADREDFPFWITLWWKEAVHFRLAEVAGEGGRSTCFWRAEDVPAALRMEYRRCNRLAS